MTRRLMTFPVLFALAAGLCAQAEEAAARKVPAELAKARSRAAVHNKRVLVVLPEPGQDLAALIKKDRSVSRTFLYEFETVQLTGDALPKVERPAMIVQDHVGKTLAKLDVTALLDGEKFDGKQLLAAVKPHFCAPVDAEQKLADARKLAKKTGRNILIRFDAPW